MRWFLLGSWFLFMVLNLIMFFVTGKMLDLLFTFIFLTFIICDLLNGR